MCACFVCSCHIDFPSSSGWHGHLSEMVLADAAPAVLVNHSLFCHASTMIVCSVRLRVCVQATASGCIESLSTLYSTLSDLSDGKPPLSLLRQVFPPIGCHRTHASLHFCLRLFQSFLRSSVMSETVTLTSSPGFNGIELGKHSEHSESKGEDVESDTKTEDLGGTRVVIPHASSLKVTHSSVLAKGKALFVKGVADTSFSLVPSTPKVCYYSMRVHRTFVCIYLCCLRYWSRWCWNLPIRTITTKTTTRPFESRVQPPFASHLMGTP